MSVYDHHRKAGNEGDICKHPALIAALDETIAINGNNPFRYSDLFAGYAMNPLAEGHEWVNGIGILAGDDLFTRNRHLSMWANLSGLEHSARGGDSYPGSAWFANEICKLRRRPIALSLWETSKLPFEDLKASFPSSEHIYNLPADPNDPLIETSDFVFIDPPDTRQWVTIVKLVARLKPTQSVLIWLPIRLEETQTPSAEDCISSAQCREEALQLGMGVSTVRWSKRERTIGCQLLYRVSLEAQMALRQALDEVVQIAHLRSGTSSEWEYKPNHLDPLDSFDLMRR
jgi:23S rRNA A2030 N6-methylase RlmJ